MDEKVIAADIPELEIREQLDRVLQSSVFSQSERLSRFLRFTIEHVVANESQVLKEYVIGKEVYDRRPPYSPSQDNIVRSEARRLRSKLKQYYESEGKADPVLIYFRPGSYVPVFRRQDAFITGGNSAQSSNGDTFVERRAELFAVVPFKDLSNTSLSSACAAAVAEELRHTLMRKDGVRVVQAETLQDVNASAFAHKSEADMSLSGTVRQEGPRLRVTVQAYMDGFACWSQQFEIQPGLDEVFKAAERIAKTLHERFHPKSSLILKKRTSRDPGILDTTRALFRSEAFLDEGTCADIEMQVDKFEQIAATVPGLAEPLSDTADCWYELAMRGAPVSPEDISKAKAKAIQASEMDPEMVPPVSCLAALFGFEWNWQASEETFKKALRLGSQASTHRKYAMLLAAKGRFDESRYQLQRAEEWDPFSHRQRTAWARFFNLSRNYAELEESVANCTLYGPLPLETQLYLALGYCQLERHREAREILEKNRRYVGAHPTVAATVAEIAGRCGASTLASELIEQFRLLGDESGISRFRQALLALATDDIARALSLLTQAVDQHDPESIWLPVDPRLDALREDDRFAELARRVTVGENFSQVN